MINIVDPRRIGSPHGSPASTPSRREYIKLPDNDDPEELFPHEHSKLSSYKKMGEAGVSRLRTIGIFLIAMFCIIVIVVLYILFSETKGRSNDDLS